ncbi:hypothetical protein OOK58_20530 [Streptomyces sp. NBC_01728]|uniref:hypothetical protein n=1 Tax=unclassified Streptomyces TaxID=2593676 RepID=UPI002251BBAC|nr:MULTISPECIES: hypothetical protein [unclassified Streptomyces]MCX4454438.1 hypothetical protein [Streptomyces sp. NBC_01719]MCX4493798.1 hypothetical protein [Streptomyces sp. NBC_01728]
MDGAVWGALGAVLGAGATAVGGYLGPLRVARAAAKERAQERREQRSEGEVARLIAIRAVYRDWYDYLYEVVDAKNAGRLSESAAEVRERIQELRKATEAATDAVMQDGWWIGSFRVEAVGTSSEVLEYIDGSPSAEDPERDPYEVPMLRYLEIARAVLNEHILRRLAEVVGGQERRLSVFEANHPPR